MCNPSEYGGCESCPEFGECSTDAQSSYFSEPREWENDHCDAMFTQEEYLLDDDYDF